MPGSTGTTPDARGVDWQSYADVFPDRYVRPSASDAVISGELSRRPPGRALDVGGGVRGTAYLREWASEYRLLDPHVRTDLPSTTWDEVLPRSYDAVVARGSVNYLSWDQIAALASSVRDGGLMAFNTFLRPASGSRRYSSRSGTGTERHRPVRDGAGWVIEHVLEPDGGDPVVHRFRWHPVPRLVLEISSAGLSCEVMRSGSTAVFLCRRP